MPLRFTVDIPNFSIAAPRSRGRAVNGTRRTPRTEIDEVVVILVPSHAAPEIGIDDAHDNLVAIAIVERFQLGGQQVDRAPHDVFVRVEAPRDARAERSASGSAPPQHERISHAGILRQLDNVTHTLFAATLARTRLREPAAAPRPR